MFNWLFGCRHEWQYIPDIFIWIDHNKKEETFEADFCLKCREVRWKYVGGSL